MNTTTHIGESIYNLARRLFPICRSITGRGVWTTLEILREHMPALVIKQIPSGTECFDWVVPDEWNIRDAYVIDPSGTKIISFAASNLHVISYSEPIDTTVSLSELQGHLYSLPDQPEAIPYVTSYYKKSWGFCLTENLRRTLQPGDYRVFIDSEFSKGHLTYGELIIPGQTSDEVFISTYVCHPSMANNELSGPCVVTHLAGWLQDKVRRRYTYRIIFIPETIGSIAYLSQNLSVLKERVIAGFNVTCIGDDREFSYLPSRDGKTIADHAAQHALKHIDANYKRYTFLDRGSDERQYCSPGVDLPVASIMRSKYGTFPEYHTSLDNLEFVTPAGLAGGFFAIKSAIEIIEDNCIPKATVLCEPQLGKRGLYPNISEKNNYSSTRLIVDTFAYADGSNSALDIAEFIGVPFSDVNSALVLLAEYGLMELSEVPSVR